MTDIGGKKKGTGAERNSPEGTIRKEENHHVQGGETGKVLSFRIIFPSLTPPLPQKKPVFLLPCNSIFPYVNSLFVPSGLCLHLLREARRIHEAYRTGRHRTSDIDRWFVYIGPVLDYTEYTFSTATQTRSPTPSSF
jgi:hypothetical protein